MVVFCFALFALELTLFFYYRYFIKSVDTGEMKALQGMLAAYLKHMYCHPDSMIRRFSGLCSIKMYGVTQHFVVMENVLRITEEHKAAGHKISEVYDIKGSWIDRHSHFNHPSDGVLKDSDLHKQIQMTERHARKMLEVATYDAFFFCQVSWSLAGWWMS